MHVYDRQIPDPRELSIKQIPGDVPGGMVTTGIDSCITVNNAQADSADSVSNILLKIYSEQCPSWNCRLCLNILLKIYSEQCPSADFVLIN